MRFIYLNKPKDGKKHNGIICMGYKFVKEDELQVGVTFCSPNDRFNKKFKVHKALPGLMDKGKYHTVIGIKKDIKYEEIVSLMKKLINHAFPEGYDDIRKYVKDMNYKVYPEFAGIKLPFGLKKFKN